MCINSSFFVCVESINNDNINKILLGYIYAIFFYFLPNHVGWFLIDVFQLILHLIFLVYLIHLMNDHYLYLMEAYLHKIIIVVDSIVRIRTNEYIQQKRNPDD
eukprot:133621_1